MKFHGSILLWWLESSYSVAPLAWGGGVGQCGHLLTVLSGLGARVDWECACLLPESPLEMGPTLWNQLKGTVGQSLIKDCLVWRRQRMCVYRVGGRSETLETPGRR